MPWQQIHAGGRAERVPVKAWLGGCENVKRLGIEKDGPLISDGEDSILMVQLQLFLLGLVVPMISIKAHSSRSMAILFLRATSVSEKSAGLPSSMNSSLK